MFDDLPDCFDCFGGLRANQNVSGKRGMKLAIATSECSRNILHTVFIEKDWNIHGSGVMLLVHKAMEHMPIVELDNNAESVWVKVFVNETYHYRKMVSKI